MWAQEERRIIEKSVRDEIRDIIKEIADIGRKEMANLWINDGDIMFRNAHVFAKREHELNAWHILLEDKLHANFIKWNDKKLELLQGWNYGPI